MPIIMIIISFIVAVIIGDELGGLQGIVAAEILYVIVIWVLERLDP